MSDIELILIGQVGEVDLSFLKGSDKNATSDNNN